MRLVLLDACRNNLLARSRQRSTATRAASQGSFRDLKTRDDGRGRWGRTARTRRRADAPETPLEIGLLFRRVWAQVLEAANGEHRPQEYRSLVSEHYLVDAAGKRIGHRSR